MHRYVSPPLSHPHTHTLSLSLSLSLSQWQWDNNHAHRPSSSTVHVLTLGRRLDIILSISNSCTDPNSAIQCIPSLCCHHTSPSHRAASIMQPLASPLLLPLLQLSPSPVWPPPPRCHAATNADRRLLRLRCQRFWTPEVQECRVVLCRRGQVMTAIGTLGWDGMGVVFHYCILMLLINTNEIIYMSRLTTKV